VIDHPANQSAPASTEPGAIHQPPRRGMEYLFILGLFVLWFVLQFWVLPKMGVPT
jgi:hypothetical protein